MGRKPNPLVTEFFERGVKLEDNSNRFQQTCKRCGELFPKGRIDSLTNHLLRKCPNVTEEDRKWVYNQMQTTTDNRAEHQVNGLTPYTTQDQLQSEIPVFQPHSALDTLAEVSRHHLDYSATQRAGAERKHEQQRSQTLGEAIAEQALIAQLQEHAYPTTTVDSNDLSMYITGLNSSQNAPQTSDAPSMMPITTLASSPLVEAASAANEQLEREQNRDQGAQMVDPQLSEAYRQFRAQADAGDNHMGQVNWSPTTTSGAQQSLNYTIMPSDPATGFGMLHKSAKSKARGRFNDTRRREVQEIRKQGACIRCRMLKKPCSEGTPCSTCRNVESARLWKGTCLRTRLAEEFTLWSTNLFFSRAKIEIGAAVQGLEKTSLSGRIEARFFVNSPLCLNFAAKAYGESPTNDESVLWILDENENVAVQKIEDYADQIAQACAEAEESTFVEMTLQRALVMIDKSEQATKVDETMPSPRACYNLQNQLLKNVVELWTLTRMLTRSNHLQIRYDPNGLPTPFLENSDWVVDNPDVANVLESSESYRLIRAQLFSAIESRCSKLSKNVMNELERRLLQRQQVSRFATFLSAVLLLSSVEIMTGLFMTFDRGDQQSKEQSTLSTGQSEGALDQTAAQNISGDAAWGDMVNRMADNAYLWPLDSPPSTLWPQGPHFSDLLTMLLRIRALPPKTGQNVDGLLVVIQNSVPPVQVHGASIRSHGDDEQTKLAAEWLDPLQLSVRELMVEKDGQFPDERDAFNCQMKFVSKILLPEHMR